MKCNFDIKYIIVLLDIILCTIVLFLDNKYILFKIIICLCGILYLIYYSESYKNLIKWVKGKQNY